MWWKLKKARYIKMLKYQLFLHPSRRNIKSSLIIHLLCDLIEKNRNEIMSSIQDVQFNPLNDSPLILHLLENYHLLKPYPVERYFIRQICMS